MGSRYYSSHRFAISYNLEQGADRLHDFFGITIQLRHDQARPAMRALWSLTTHSRVIGTWL